MFRGYYNLTSGMLTQSKNLNVISNNLTNVTTSGFKKDVLVSGSFREELVARTGHTDKSNTTQLGSLAMVKTPLNTYTNYTQGILEDTGRIYDFAIDGKGFFEIDSPDGPVYTRNGSFTVDNEGYLALGHVGRVMGEKGHIYVKDGFINTDIEGYMYNKNDQRIDKLKINDFTDYDQLVKVGEGMLVNNNPANQIAPRDSYIKWMKVEGSNVNPTEEMANMMSSQKSIQSSSQLIKMYDQMMAKATTEIGRV